MARSFPTQLPAPARVALGASWRVTWRRAFAGLTATVVVILAALIFARSVSWALHQPLPRPVDEVLQETLFGFLYMFVMTLPSLLAIVVVGNLGPQRGWRRRNSTTGLSQQALRQHSPGRSACRFLNLR